MGRSFFGDNESGGRPDNLSDGLGHFVPMAWRLCPDDLFNPSR